MAVVSAKEMLLKAAREGYCVGAFNVTNLIQMEGVIDAAVARKAPLIIQNSTTPAKFIGVKVWAAAYRAIAQDAPIPICLHLDHCEEVDLCKRAADAGYTNIMIDASQHDFNENIRITREVADYCHKLGASVEGELGTVAGVEDQVSVVEDQAKLADPAKAAEYVQRSGVDLFAPAIGTAHGVYTTENPKIDFERLGQINQIINGRGVRTPLIIHGGTGLKPDVVRKLVSLGGAKFNVSTELKYVWIDAVHDYISANRKEYNPGRIDKAARQAIKAKIEAWIDLLGCAGKAE